jgi:putative N6-adenine-specific DNA methylase
MPRFLALTSRGLGGALHSELAELGFKKLEMGGPNVSFDGSWKEMYRAHLQSRVANRILLPVLDFQAYNAEDLYNAIFKKHDFTKYIAPEQTIAVESHVFEHRELRDQRFVAQKTKDAIVDQFRKKFDRRPDVDAKNSDLQVVVRVNRTEISVAIDLTGEPMSFRGYRSQAGEAPLRETMAAGLVDIADWNPEQPLLDPMCGSGTLLIEAALKARGGLLPRKSPFLFQHLQNFDSAAFAKAQAEAANSLKSIQNLKLYGFDKDPKVIAFARANAERAGVAGAIHFEVCKAEKLVLPTELKNQTGVLICNPPYAVRLGQEKEIERLWEDFSHTLKTQFQGWSCWLLSGNKDVANALHLKTDRKVPVYNGPMECRFLHYQIR